MPPAERKTKSYRGCQRCKKARRRCTEEKPRCSHCEKVNVECVYDTDKLFRFSDVGAPTQKPTTKVTRPTQKTRSSPSSRSSSGPLSSLSPPSVTVAAAHQATVTSPASIFGFPSPHLPFQPRAFPPPNVGYNAQNHAMNPPTPDPFGDLLNFDDENEQELFNFFHLRLPKVFPYINLFRWTAATLFSKTARNDAMKETVYAINDLLKYQDLHQKMDTETSLQTAQRHLNNAFNYLYERLNQLQKNPGATEGGGETICTFLLAHVSLMLNQVAGARVHLDGFFQLLKNPQPGQPDPPYPPSPSETDGLTYLIWRMALRIDFITAIATCKEPVLPLLDEEEEGEHQQWILRYSDSEDQAHDAEWAEAWFALDALMHRTCHVATQVHKWREDLRRQKDDFLVILIKDKIDSLSTAHRKWRERSVVRRRDDEEREKTLSLTSDLDNASLQSIIPGTLREGHSWTSESGFLDYTPMRIFDPFFASRLNNWRAIKLLISLIRNPEWAPYDGPRFVTALDLCRTHAALGDEKNFLGAEKAVGLFLAGIAFGGPDVYKPESEWVIQQLEEITRYYQIADSLKKRLISIWEKKGNYFEQWMGWMGKDDQFLA